MTARSAASLDTNQLCHNNLLFYVPLHCYVAKRCQVPSKTKEASCLDQHVVKDSLCMALQAKQREQCEFEQRAARIQKLEARQKQEEGAAVKALGQQLLAHQVILPSHQSSAILLYDPAHKVVRSQHWHDFNLLIRFLIFDTCHLLGHCHFFVGADSVIQTPARLCAHCSAHTGRNSCPCMLRLSIDATHYSSCCHHNTCGSDVIAPVFDLIIQ